MDTGVRVSGDGSVHWDDRVVYNQIPPQGQAVSHVVGDCLQHGCSDDDVYHRALDATAAALAALGPPGMVAGGLLELVNYWAPPRANIDWSWEAQFGQYDSGPPGSIWAAGNKQLRATYDGLLASGKWPGSEAGVYAVLASQLSAFVAAWDASHAGPLGDWTIGPTNRSTGWDSWHRHLPADWSPMAVAANYLVTSAGGPENTTFHFSANAGPVTRTATTTAAANFGPADTARAPAPMSSGAKVVLAGGAVVAGIALFKPALLQRLIRR